MAKKNFSTSAGIVDLFLSTPAQNIPQEVQEEQKGQNPEGVQAPQTGEKVHTRKRKKGTSRAEDVAIPYTEKFSRRVQLVFPPSLYEKVKAQAQAKGHSFNGYVIELLARETLES